MPYSTIRIPDDQGQHFGALHWAGATPNVSTIVLVQEIFGLNAFVLDRAAWLNSLGYCVVAPDLYWRQKQWVNLDPNEPDAHAQAMAYLAGLDRASATADLKATIRAVQSRSAIGSKLGALGYCLGGALVFELAMAGQVDAAAAFYPIGLDKCETLHFLTSTPTQLHLAQNDRLYPPGEIHRLVARLSGASHIAAHVHPATDHAFCRPGSVSYNRHACDLAHAAVQSFLSVQLVDTPL